MKTTLFKSFFVLLAFWGLSTSSAYAETAAQLKTTIETFVHGGTGTLTATVSGNTITVTGTVTGVTKTSMNLNINTGLTVLWKASYSCPANSTGLSMIRVDGGGTFEVGEGGMIKQTSGISQALLSNGLVKINGGTVSSNGSGAAIYARQGTIEVNSGIVENTGSGNAVQVVIGYSGNNTYCTVNGGTVRTTGSGSAIFNNNSASPEYPTTTVNGGTVENTGSGHAIGSEGSNNIVININGGTVRATGSSSAVYCTGNGNVTISGGTVTAVGDALVNNSTGTINISGTANVSTTTTGVMSAIYNPGTGKINISGGTISGAKGYGIYSSSTGEINVTGGTVTSEGNAIWNESTGTINISGTANVSTTTTNKNAIYNKSTGKIKINGGTISGGQGYGIYNVDGTVTISGGTVTSDKYAVTNGHTGVVNISGGTVSSKEVAIYINFEGKVTISGTALITSNTKDNATIVIRDQGGDVERLNITGGTVENTANHVKGIAIYNESKGSIKITGGKVLAKEGYAIRSDGTGTLTLSGGIVFAYGTIDTDVIKGNYTRSDNAVIVAWNKSAGHLTYSTNTSNDIYKLPTAAKAVWAKQGSDSGISVTYNTNTGFIPIADVTIGATGISDIESEKISVYPNPTTGVVYLNAVNNVKVYNQQGVLLQEKISDSVNLSGYESGAYLLQIGNEWAKVVKK